MTITRDEYVELRTRVEALENASTDSTKKVTTPVVKEDDSTSSTK